MRIIFFLFFLFFSIFNYAQVDFSKSVEKKVNKVVGSYLDIELFDYEVVNSIPQLGLKENHIFKVLNNGEHIGYFVLDQSMGQHDSFDYLVVFDKNLTIRTVKLLNYREDYGYEISSKWWLSQFRGKKGGKQMKYKDDIDGLSGATISAKSITDSLKILSQNMFYWKNMDMI